MSKYTASSVELELNRKIGDFHERARAIKDEYRQARQAILDNVRLSATAQQEDIATLKEQTRDKLRTLQAEQQSFVESLKGNIERELRGSQPADANSIMLRRDAAARARKISDEAEALAMLEDAAWSGDESLAHAVGHAARQTGWFNAIEKHRESFPETSDSGAAIAFVESYTTGGGYNLANGIAYSDPTTA